MLFGFFIWRAGRAPARLVQTQPLEVGLFDTGHEGVLHGQDAPGLLVNCLMAEPIFFVNPFHARNTPRLGPGKTRRIGTTTNPLFELRGSEAPPSFRSNPAPCFANAFMKRSSGNRSPTPVVQSG